jgi:Ca2+-binding RTX toxin-like protein
VLIASLADAAVNEDSFVNIALPAGAFSDVDGDVLAYSARLANGFALPNWLALDSPTGRLTGQPPANFTGSLDIEIFANDGLLSVSDVFRLTVTAVNDAPVVALALADRSSNEDMIIDFALPLGSFTDADNATLTYSATLTNSAALPSWLSFNASTQRFTGTPPANFNGAMDIRVTASDGSLFASDDFRLTINPVNDAPAVVTPLTDTVASVGTTLSYIVPAGSFVDLDGDVLTYSAVQSNGSALPGWLSFDGSTRSFTGTPPNGAQGNYDIRVTASDGSLTASDIFRLTVNLNNVGPAVAVALPDRSSGEDAAFDFTLAANSFTDANGDTLSYTARLAGGAALPVWIGFNGSTRSFTGTPPANFNGTIDIEVVASDGALSAADIFRLTISPVNDTPVAVNDGGLTVATGSSLTIAPATLLANDSDPDGTAPTLQSVGGAVNGTVAINGTGQIVFTPTISAAGTGSFTYTITDGALTSTATVTLSVTQSGTPWVYGTSGNDNINGAMNAVNRIDGGAGNDTITGGNLNDELVGGLGNDNLYAGAGNDTINGGDGDDTVTGDAGDDIINGGAGADKLYGGTGNDTINAGDGADTVTGDDGNDIITGGAGNDLLYAGAGNDTVDAGDGDDTVTGDAGTDVLTGGLGNDTMYGGADNDTISGGDGADKLYGDGGNDIMSGGNGNDIIDGGAGTDTLDTSYSAAAWTINLSTNIAQSGMETDTVYNMENVTSGAGADTITGTNAANSINSGDGNDTINAGAGDDTVNSGAGNDTITGGTGNDIMVGGLGSDTLVLTGLQASYSITTVNGTVRIVDNQPTVDGNDGTDTISGIEILRFKNGATVNITSPIILDLDGNGVRTLSAADSNARYDLDGDGLADDTSWFGATEGMLILDRNGDGKVNGANEFSFIDDVDGAKSDLEGLRAFDSNKDGILSSADARFADFRVWVDRDGDGVQEEGELQTLTQVGVRSLNLTGTAVESTTQLGEVAVLNKGSYTRTNGATMEYIDAALTYFSSATNLPAITVQQMSYERKAGKYVISYANGEMTLNPKKKKGEIDPRVGALTASSLLTFKNKTIGLLSPIILDLDGDGVEMVSIKKAKAGFDMNGDGIADDTGWAGKGDGFLVIDRNNDGKITGASELSFANEDKDARSDLEALAALDNNNDGVLNKNDARFGELKVWVDANGNGVTDAGELKTLTELGITEIGLRAQNREGTAGIGDNVLISTATFKRENGSTGTVGNVALAYKPGKAAAAGNNFASLDRRRIPDRISIDEPVDMTMIGDEVPTENAQSTDALVASLRTRQSSGLGNLNFGSNVPNGIDPFDYFGNDELDLAAFSQAAYSTEALSTKREGLKSVELDNAVQPSVSSLDSDKVLALIAQDMAAFGARRGEAEPSWRRDGVKPVDYFA